MDKLSTLAIVGILMLSPWATLQAATPAGSGFTPDRPASLFGCQAPLLKLLASSNQALIQAEKVPANKLEITIEPRDDGAQAIQLFDSRQQASPDTPGAGHLGWVMYDPQSGQLLGNSADEQHPLQLTFNPQYGKQYQQCLQKELRCQAIFQQMKLGPIIADSPKNATLTKTASPAANYRVKSKRLYFYNSPDKLCKGEAGKFVVNGDSVTAKHRQAYNEFLFVSYIHPKSGDKTEGWVKIEGLAVR